MRKRCEADRKIQYYHTFHENSVTVFTRYLLKMLRCEVNMEVVRLPCQARSECEAKKQETAATMKDVALKAKVLQRPSPEH